MHRIYLIATAFAAAVWGGNAHAECLIRTVTYGANETVDSSSPKTAMVEVPVEEVSTYVEAGYVPASCTAAQGTKKIDGCALASFGNEAVQDRFTALFGMAPARICASQRRLEGKAAITQTPDK